MKANPPKNKSDSHNQLQRYVRDKYEIQSTNYELITLKYHQCYDK